MALARWEIGPAALPGSAPSKVDGSASLTGERITNADAWATLGKNRATAKGSFGGPRDRAEWTLHVPDLAALVEGLAGEIRANGSAAGTWKQPSAVVNAQASGLRLAEALVFERASVKASGTLEKHEGELTAVNDEFDLKATLRGGWRGNAWRGEIASLKNGGEYPLELKTPAALEAGAQRVVLGRFEAALPAGGRAAVESVRWEGKRLTSRGSISAMPAQWLLTAARVDQVTGDLVLEGDWDLAATPKLNGRVAVRRASGDLAFGATPMELSAAAVEATFTEDRVAAKAAIASRLASARVEGTLAAPTRDAALAATAEIEAAELRSLTEPLFTQARVSGRVAATLRVGGHTGKTRCSPELCAATRSAWRCRRGASRCATGACAPSSTPTGCGSPRRASPAATAASARAAPCRSRATAAARRSSGRRRSSASSAVPTGA